MAVMTEDDAKKIISEKNLQSGSIYEISPGQILTPSARALFTEKNIQLRHGTGTKKFKTLLGFELDEKPEHMTHLRGNLLVFKDHPRIEFRGMIDLTESEIIRVQLRRPHLKRDLQEIIDFLRLLLRCEVSGEPVGEFKLLGLDAAALREHSHHPSKYYGVSHFLPGCEYGEAVADLNFLRTLVRRLELCAYKALKYDDRDDIIRGLNRLSSLFWVMMIKEVKNGTDSD